MTPISIVYFGSPEIAILPLQALLKDHHFKVWSVVSQEDTAIKTFAILNKLIVQDFEAIQKMEQQPDFFVVCAYGKIFPKRILEIPKFGSINIHFSLLPKYRGASPVQEALLCGEKTTGVTFISMDEDLDAGDVLFQEAIPIKNNDTAATLSEKLSILSAKLLPKLLVEITEGKHHLLSQDHKRATYCRKIRKEDGHIHPQNETAEDIWNKIRAYSPWPGCFMEIGGKRVKILYATPIDEQKIRSGKWLIDGEKLILGTKKNSLLIEQLHPEGKKPIGSREFINGYRRFL